MARFSALRIPGTSKGRNTTPGSAIRAAAVATAVLGTAAPCWAADVTADRLINADQEPQNWLMNHRTYDGQRFSPLARINRGNVKNLKLAYAVPLGGTARQRIRWRRRHWSRMASSTSPTAGASSTRSTAPPAMSAASSGAWIPSRRSRPIIAARRFGAISSFRPPTGRRASSRPTRRPARSCGKQTCPFGEAQLRITAAPLAIKDKIFIGAAGGDSGVRDWVASARCGNGQGLVAQVHHSGAGRARQRDLEGQQQCLADRRRRRLGDRHLRSRDNQTIWGTGNPVPMFDPTYRPGDNLFTNSAISWDPETGNMNWYFQYTPGDMWDYDEVGTHILIDSEVAGQPRKLDHPFGAQRLPLHDGPRTTGRSSAPSPIWTNQLDQGHRPEDRQADRLRPQQGHADLCGRRQPHAGRAAQAGLPVHPRRQQLLADRPTVRGPSSSTSRRLTGCQTCRGRSAPSTRPSAAGTAATATSAERYRKQPHRRRSGDPARSRRTCTCRTRTVRGTLSTGGGLVFVALLDGTVAAFDDTTLDELWKINVGSGFSAPPMTFEVNGKQYVAIASGTDPASGKRRLVNTPELKEQRNATVLYVFGL